MNNLSLSDCGPAFEILLLESNEAVCTVLFAVGSGGNPDRHLPLLQSLAANGCSVVAPYFERVTSPRPTEEELILRARRLRLALDHAAKPGVPAIGVGHSIGATILLALAGAELWLGVGHQLPITHDERLMRLVLLAPATGFFQAPGALDALEAPLLVWAGSDDTITPPSQARFLKQAVDPRLPVEVRIAEGAGHFSFMNQLPPHIIDPLVDREAFLTELAAETGRFVHGELARNRNFCNAKS